MYCLFALNLLSSVATPSCADPEYDPNQRAESYNSHLIRRRDSPRVNIFTDCYLLGVNEEFEKNY